jgi:hypothetical protein
LVSLILCLQRSESRNKYIITMTTSRPSIPHFHISPQTLTTSPKWPGLCPGCAPHHTPLHQDSPVGSFDLECGRFGFFSDPWSQAGRSDLSLEDRETGRRKMRKGHPSLPPVRCLHLTCQMLRGRLCHPCSWPVPPGELIEPQMLDKCIQSQAGWCVPVTSAPGRLREEGHKFEANLG